LWEDVVKLLWIDFFVEEFGGVYSEKERNMRNAGTNGYRQIE